MKNTLRRGGIPVRVDRVGYLEWQKGVRHVDVLLAHNTQLCTRHERSADQARDNCLAKPAGSY